MCLNVKCTGQMKRGCSLPAATMEGKGENLNFNEIKKNLTKMNNFVKCKSHGAKTK